MPRPGRTEAPGSKKEREKLNLRRRAITNGAKKLGSSERCLVSIEKKCCSIL